MRLWFSVFVVSSLVYSSLVAAEPTTVPVGQAMTEVAAKFLATLTADERAKVERSFDDSARVDWHNIPKPTRKGLQVGEMSAAQREACHQLLRAGLSETGYAKAVKIMSLENNLLVG